MKIVRPMPIGDIGAFTRGSTAVYRDSTGALQTAAINTARWDYDPNNLAAGPTLLVEDQSTNLFYPSDLNTPPASCGPAVEATLIWTPMNLLGYQDFMIRCGRANSSTSWAFNEWAINGLVDGKEYTFSFYIMNDNSTGTTQVYLMDLDRNLPSGAASGVDITWEAGVPTVSVHRSLEQAVADIVTVTDVGGMMYRVSFRIPAGYVLASHRNRFRVLASSKNGFVANEGVFVGGVQVELGKQVTSLIPTQNAAVTRAAEVMTARMLAPLLEDDAPVYAPGTSYAQDAKVIYVSTDPVTGFKVHKLYQSLIAANAGHQPDISPTQWEDIGHVNRWRMFDGTVGAQTTSPTSITFAIKIVDRVDSIALLNVAASAIRIQMMDAIEGMVFDQTFDMLAETGSADWWSYFFEPIEYLSDLVFTGLPLYANAIVQVTLMNVAGTVKCGECVMGLSRDIGFTQYGAGIGIQDYSVKSQDDWGNYTIVQRAYRKTGKFTVITGNGLVDRLATLLASYRATPLVWIGTEELKATAIYGFYRDFSLEIEYPTESVCSLELEGLT